jgi:FAD/FMN-containing dehydrogenase
MTTARFYDYGKLYLSAARYDEYRPETIYEAQSQICAVLKVGNSVRVWAGGNSMSGAALPRKDETLLRLKGLNHFRFEIPGTISVGVGAMLWDVRDMLETFNYVLPVYNGGWGAPSVGGFINAGGVGTCRRLDFLPEGVAKERAGLGYQSLDSRIDSSGEEIYLDVEGYKGLSELHGGFWENVMSVTLIDGMGERRVIERGHDDFPWLFGSYGQLGVMVEATLRIIPSEEALKPTYPLGQSGRVALNQPEDSQFSNSAPTSGGMEHLYWMSYAVSVEQEQKAWSELAEMVPRHMPYVKPVSGFVGPRGQDGKPIGYRYFVTHKEFHPPLLYPRPEDFVLMGVMAIVNVGKASFDRQLLAFEKDFVEIATRNNFCLYMQAENTGRWLDYETYYSADVYALFKTLKQKYDPENRINPGVIFDRVKDTPQLAYQARRQVGTLAQLFSTSDAAKND